jgi:hypothetical protein
VVDNVVGAVESTVAESAASEGTSYSDSVVVEVAFL